LKFISHRGNLTGPSALENSPVQVDKSIKLGFECEIDIRIMGNVFYLGHDAPEYQVEFDWLLERASKLWIHCKNFEALNFFSTRFDSKLNFFWHEKDRYTLTSKGYIWAYPGAKTSKNCVAVLPEIWNDNGVTLNQLDCAGVCSDYIQTYVQKFEITQ
jgi:hypothetical protein